MRDIDISLLQAPLLWQDPAGNRNALRALIDEHAPDSDLVVLPETFASGFTMEVDAVAEPPDGATVQWLSELAQRHQATLCGSLVIADAGRHFNRFIWAAPDGTVQHYDKRHLFRLGGEHKRYSAGRERLIVQLGDWRVCPLVCYDLRFPVWSRNHDDYDLLLYVANWPEARRAAWEILLPARAVENQCYVAGVNRSGVDGNGLESAGHSVICDYLGTRLAAAGSEAAVLKATLSLDALEAFRSKYPFAADADAFTLSDEPSQP